MAGQTSI